MNQKRRIIIVDDEPMMSNLLKKLFEDEPDFEVSEIAVNKNEFFQFIDKGKFDVALMDISIGEREGGMDILKTLRQRQNNLPVVILSAHDEEDYALRCLTIGANGYVNKNYICSELTQGLNEVLNGNYFVSGYKGSYILKEFKKLLEKASPIN
jgi:two-component system, NarL family, invasion response regulator UvrY